MPVWLTTDNQSRGAFPPPQVPGRVGRHKPPTSMDLGISTATPWCLGTPRPIASSLPLRRQRRFRMPAALYRS
jgi:hypothetical protein